MYMAWTVSNVLYIDNQIIIIAVQINWDSIGVYFILSIYVNDKIKMWPPRFDLHFNVIKIKKILMKAEDLDESILHI